MSSSVLSRQQLTGSKATTGISRLSQPTKQVVIALSGLSLLSHNNGESRKLQVVSLLLSEATCTSEWKCLL